jgi:predicted RNA-binding Zn ribbon-like protein
MSNPAPGDLERVRAFVNTWDAEDDSDAISSPDALRAWLAEQGWLEVDAKVTAADQRRAAGVREALRATLRAHHGHPDEECAQDVLCDASERAKLQVLFDKQGNSRLVPAAGGIDGAIGRILTIAHEADREGQWIRLKVCPADDCQAAFYDRSRNHSATWCDMKVCGNRHKVREYRERRLRGATA